MVSIIVGILGVLGTVLGVLLGYSLKGMEQYKEQCGVILTLCEEIQERIADIEKLL